MGWLFPVPICDLIRREEHRRKQWEYIPLCAFDPASAARIMELKTWNLNKVWSLVWWGRGCLGGTAIFELQLAP